ncbi:hypothetical protein [Nakamurella aerolata]|uniref:Heparin binding hemagglutinin HbhA n=1 Tax=Nakamurella aerolata TaxID=1656892 RepID=A0A849A2Y5_9ACTN|nr:hypothetical protein [Nakamurella aerolata]NNG34969.1 hypothetical protein [Nakamurella aerolata]
MADRDFTEDFTERAQAALTKLADRMPNLPGPVLAAIGAADVAGRQLVELVNSLADKSPVKPVKPQMPKMPERGEVVDELRSVAQDLPSRLQHLAEDAPEKLQDAAREVPEKARALADQLEQFATALPGKVQRLADELPDKAREVGEQLQPDQLRQSADAYRELLASVYATLTERGGKAWEELRNTGPVPGTVVDGRRSPKNAMDHEETGEAVVSDLAAKRGARSEAPVGTPAAKRPARRRPTPKPDTGPNGEGAAAGTAGTDKAGTAGTDKAGTATTDRNSGADAAGPAAGTAKPKRSGTGKKTES